MRVIENKAEIEGQDSGIRYTRVEIEWQEYFQKRWESDRDGRGGGRGRYIKSQKLKDREKGE